MEHHKYHLFCVIDPRTMYCPEKPEDKEKRRLSEKKLRLKDIKHKIISIAEMVLVWLAVVFFVSLVAIWVWRVILMLERYGCF